MKEVFKYVLEMRISTLNYTIRVQILITKENPLSVHTTQTIYYNPRKNYDKHQKTQTDPKTVKKQPKKDKRRKENKNISNLQRKNLIMQLPNSILVTLLLTLAYLRIQGIHIRDQMPILFISQRLLLSWQLFLPCHGDSVKVVRYADLPKS